MKSDQKECQYFVQTDVSYLNQAIAQKFLIKNTVMQLIKHGSKDLIRIGNSMFLDEEENLEQEPEVLGNLKRKRLLKHYRKC